MKIRLSAVLLVLALVLSACGNTVETPVSINDNIEEIAVNLVTDLSGGNFKKAFEEYRYTEEVQNTISTSFYKNLWNSITLENGNFKEIAGFSVSESQGFDVIAVETAFDKAKLNLNIVFDADKIIAGIQLRPYIEPKEIPENITETPLTFGDANWKLNGILTTPKDSSQRSPILILVHGSGPNDMDETVGSNKPFRDIAWGLAQKGIRTIRYNKRTYTYGEKMAIDTNITVNEETIEDVVHAVQYLELSSSIVPGNIYILGHSLGGMLIPRIAPKVMGVSGYIMMSAPVTPLEDLMVEQIKYISEVDGFTEQENQVIKAYEDMRNNVKKVSSTSKLTADKLFGIPAAYWLDLKGYDLRKMAKEIQLPLLVLQGERDYQVTMKEFDFWMDALQEKENVTLKSYEGLNHLMMYGTEKSSPSEYNTTGEVDTRVIEDISSWILSR